MAYSDGPLPIGAGQTISQPYTVAFMLEVLELKETDKVLEVGAGSGWNAALIGEIVKKGKVITTEIIPELAEQAKENIKKIKLKNVEIINCDGSQGYKKSAPYNKIILTAACPEIPQPLIDQLKDPGKLLIPIGKLICNLELIEKKDNEIIEHNLGGCAFVPLVGKHGF